MKRLLRQVLQPSMSVPKGRPHDMTWNIGTTDSTQSAPDIAKKST